MRRNLFYALIALSATALGVVFTSETFKQKKKKAFAELNVAVKEESVSKNRHFVVVIASYNNEEYCLRNLESVFSQEYAPFEVVYTDDASSDKTREKVLRYVEEKGVQDRFTFIHNEENKKALYNFTRMIHGLDNSSIVVVLDGDDWFAHKYVLRDLNHYYENRDVWMTYGQYIRYPDQSLGCSKPVEKALLKEGKVRSLDWRFSHLRTFYAGLFKRIKLADLLYDGDFYTSGGDLATMYPMLEMAREHAFYTPDLFYVYNYDNPLTDAKIHAKEQEWFREHIRKKAPYAPLSEPPWTPFGEKSSDVCDIIVFSYNRPMQLYAFLESAYKYIEDVRKIGVIYRASGIEYEKGFERVKEAFPQAFFYKQSPSNDVAYKEFKPMLMEMLKGEFGKGADYVAFAVDDIIVKEPISLKKDIAKMQEMGAYGFYYRLGKHVHYCHVLDQEQGTPKFLDVDKEVLAWQFCTGKADWDYPNSVDLTLFEKNRVIKDFEKLKFKHPNDIEGAWSKIANDEEVGLCHQTSKMINIPMNIVSTAQNRCSFAHSAEELNRFFMDGLKIDIAPFYQISNPSAHVELEVQFIPRRESATNIE